MNNEINKLKSDFEKLSENPSADLWNRLEQKLDEKPQKKIWIRQYWWIAAASIIFLTGLLFPFSDTQEPTNLMVKKNELPTLEKKPELVLENDNPQTTISTFNENKKEDINPSIIQENRGKLVVQSSKKHSEQLQIKEENRPIISKIEKQEKAKAIHFEKLDTLEKIVQQENIQKEESRDYISTDDLLFERALNETAQENQANPKFKMGLNVKTPIQPQSIEIIGIEIYHSEQK